MKISAAEKITEPGRESYHRPNLLAAFTFSKILADIRDL